MISAADQAANRVKLIAALRSGDYKQTKGRLHDKHGFDLLGVACDLYIRADPFGDETWVYWEKWAQYGMKPDPETDKHAINTYGTLVTGVLPYRVRDFFGFATAVGDNRRKDGMALINYNDQGKTFAEIADILEQDREIALESDLF